MYCLALLAVGGAAPIRDFVFYEIPRLASGEAFDFFKRDIVGKAGNYSMYGLPYRLELLGLVRDPGAIAAGLSKLYTGILLVTALFVGAESLRSSRGGGEGQAARAPRAGDARATRLILWFALFNLAVLRSPFLPPYGFIGTVWMVAVWALHTRTVARGAALFVPAYLGLNFLASGPGRGAIIAGTLVILLDVVLNVAALVVGLWRGLHFEEAPARGRS